MKKITMPVAIVISVCVVSVSSLAMFFCSLIDRQEERQHEMVMRASQDAVDLIVDYPTNPDYYQAAFAKVYNEMIAVK